MSFNPGTTTHASLTPVLVSNRPVFKKADTRACLNLAPHTFVHAFPKTQVTRILFSRMVSEFFPQSSQFILSGYFGLRDLACIHRSKFSLEATGNTNVA